MLPWEVFSSFFVFIKRKHKQFYLKAMTICASYRTTATSCVFQINMRKISISTQHMILLMATIKILHVKNGGVDEKMTVDKLVCHLD